MIFFIFLFSVAALELFILRRPDIAVDKDLQARTKSAGNQIAAPPAVSGTPGLHNLGHVLEQHGRGLTPDIRSTESAVTSTPPAGS